MTLNYLVIWELAENMKKGSKVLITVVGEGNFEGIVANINETEIAIENVVVRGERNEGLGTIVGQLRFRLDQIDKMKCLDQEFASINARKEAMGKVMKPHVKPSHLLQQTIPTDQAMVMDGIKSVESCPMPDCNYMIIDNQDSQEFADAIKFLNDEIILSLGHQGVRVSRSGELCWLVFGTNDSHRIFLFDILQIGDTAAFDGGLKSILENPKIMKITHDCRFLSDCLWHKYQVAMNNIFDTQVSRIVLHKMANNGEFPRFVDSFSITMTELMPHVKFPQLMIRSYNAEEDEMTWKVRPLPQPLMKYLILQVIYLPSLRTVVMDKLMADHANCVNLYLKLVRSASPSAVERFLEAPHTLPDNFIQERAEISDRVESRRQQRRPSELNTKTGFRESRTHDSDVRYSRDTWHKLVTEEKKSSPIKEETKPIGPPVTEMGFTGTPLTNAILSQSGANGNIININGTENSAKEQLRAVGIDSNPVKSTNLGLGRGVGLERMGKSKFVLVAIESVITGHRRFTIRERLGEKVEALFIDPMLRRTVLYKEAKKVKGKDSIPPAPADPVV